MSLTSVTKRHQKHKLNSFVMIENKTKGVMAEVQDYLRLRKELLKTEATIKITQIISSILVTIIGIVLFTLITTFIVLSIVFIIKPIIGEIYAFMIGAIIFILICIFIYLLKKYIIEIPIAKFITKIIEL